MSLDIRNVIRVSISGAEKGLQNVNTSALAVFVDEAPISPSYGVFGVYLNDTGVADDFGSNSDTYRLANKVFSQKRNVITGKGFLIVIPRLQSAGAQAAAILSQGNVNLLDLGANDYNINVAVDGGAAADLLIGELDLTSLETAEASLNSPAVTAAGLVFTLSGALNSAQVTLKTVSTGATAAIVIGTAGTGTDIAPGLKLSGSATGADAGLERIKDAILRTQGSVNYFGIVYNEKMSDADLQEVAATVQSLDKFQAVASNLTADIGGVFTTIKDLGYTQTRCLIHTGSEDEALDFAAAYMSRLMSINFNAANSALTMHLKDMVGVLPDTGMNQGFLDAAQKAGVDFYGDFGIGKVFTSNANLFSDQVYTRLALKVDLQIAGFNYLAQTTTKIPQTEEGMDGLKGAYRGVLAIHTTAGVYAPGTWTGSTKFGDPADHDRNIEEFGYYIYSQPVAQQSQAERDTRTAPLAQIAAKESGAIHGSDLSVLIEA